MESINFSLLQSDNFLTFGQRVIGIYGTMAETDNKFGLYPFYKVAVAAYSNYSIAFERESKNPYTVQLAEKDALRDASFTAFRNYIEACSHRNKDGYYNAASKIIVIIRKYGWSAAGSGYADQTAAITGIIDDINTNGTSELNLLSATDWFDEMVNDQQSFEETQKQSVTQENKDDITLTEARPALINAIRSLVSITDLQYSANKDNTELAGYVNALNELITLTMSTARANETRRENEKKNANTAETNN